MNKRRCGEKWISCCSQCKTKQKKEKKKAKAGWGAGCQAEKESRTNGFRKLTIMRRLFMEIRAVIHIPSIIHETVSDAVAALLCLISLRAHKLDIKTWSPRVLSPLPTALPLQSFATPSLLGTHLSLSLSLCLHLVCSYRCMYMALCFDP